MHLGIVGCSFFSRRWRSGRRRRRDSGRNCLVVEVQQSKRMCPTYRFCDCDPGPKHCIAVVPLAMRQVVPELAELTLRSRDVVGDGVSEHLVVDRDAEHRTDARRHLSDQISEATVKGVRPPLAPRVLDEPKRSGRQLDFTQDLEDRRALRGERLLGGVIILLMLEGVERLKGLQEVEVASSRRKVRVA